MGIITPILGMKIMRLLHNLPEDYSVCKRKNRESAHICLVLNCTLSPLSHAPLHSQLPETPFPLPVAFIELRLGGGFVWCTYSELLDFSVPIHNTPHRPASSD